jgi:hypothetical protein
MITFQSGILVGLVAGALIGTTITAWLMNPERAFEEDICLKRWLRSNPAATL